MPTISANTAFLAKDNQLRGVYANAIDVVTLPAKTMWGKRSDLFRGTSQFLSDPAGKLCLPENC